MWWRTSDSAERPAGTVALVLAAWVRHWWTRSLRLRCTALAIATAAVVAQLGAWSLIGWGLT